jgi:hypothetical protein
MQYMLDNLPAECEFFRIDSVYVVERDGETMRPAGKGIP